MSTIKPNKTDSVEVLAHQAAAHPITIVGASMDARTKRRVVLFMYHGFVEAAANTNPGTFLVQIRPDAGDGSVNEHWKTVAEYVVKDTTPDTEAMTATEPAAETVLAVAATAGFVARDLLYIQDAGELADSEWAECQEIVTDTSINLVDGLTTEKDNADVIWNDASRFVCALDLNGIESYRVIWSHEGAAGANGHVKVIGTTYDSDDQT